MSWFLLSSFLMASQTQFFKKGDRIEILLQTGTSIEAYYMEGQALDWKSKEHFVVLLENGQVMRLRVKDIQDIQKVEPAPVQNTPQKVSLVEPGDQDTAFKNDKQYFLLPTAKALGAGKGSINQRMVLTTGSFGISDKVSAHIYAFPSPEPLFYSGSIRYMHAQKGPWTFGATAQVAMITYNSLVAVLGTIDYSRERFQISLDVGGTYSPQVQSLALVNVKGHVQVSDRFSLMSETSIPFDWDCSYSCELYGGFLSIWGGRFFFSKPKGGFRGGAFAVDFGVFLWGNVYVYDFSLDFDRENILPFLGLGWYY